MDTARTQRQDTRPYLIVGTPCYGGVVAHSYMRSAFALSQFAMTAGWTVSIELLSNDSLITRARNTLVTRLLDTPDATHLLFVDADIGFSIDQVRRMVAFDRDVVAGLYPLKLFDWSNGGLARACHGESLETAPMRYVGTPCEGAQRELRDGFVTGIYAGTGFMLIKRDAILRLAQANPQLRFRGAHTPTAPVRDRDEFALFDCMIDPESGVYLSEDYAFCKRWRDIDGQIWLDTQGALSHFGPLEFHGDPAMRFRPQDRPAAWSEAA